MLPGEDQLVDSVGAYLTYDDDATFMILLVERGMPNRRFAFAQVNDAGATVPARTFHWAGGGVVSTVVSTGRVNITFGGLARRVDGPPEAIFVVANSTTGERCRILGWEDDGQDMTARVLCVDGAGQPVQRGFHIPAPRITRRTRARRGPCPCNRATHPAPVAGTGTGAHFATFAMTAANAAAGVRLAPPLADDLFSWPDMLR